jgi:hypothetical protein
MINSVVRLVMIWMFGLLIMLSIHGCSSTPISSTPIRPSGAKGVVFQRPIDVTRNATVNALQSMHFTIEKGYNSGDVYVEGEKEFTLLPERGIGFHICEAKYMIWLESLGELKTKVYFGYRDCGAAVPGFSCAEEAKKVILANDLLPEMVKILGESQ